MKRSPQAHFGCRLEGLRSRSKRHNLERFRRFEPFVASVEDQIFDLRERAIPPDCEFFIEQCGGPADLHAGNIKSTEFSRNFGDFASRDALDVHLGNRQLQGPFAAFPTFQRRWIELTVTRLRDVQFEFPKTAVDRFVFEAVGIGASIFSPLVGLSGSGIRYARFSWLR